MNINPRRIGQPTQEEKLSAKIEKARRKKLYPAPLQQSVRVIIKPMA